MKNILILIFCLCAGTLGAEPLEVLLQQKAQQAQNAIYPSTNAHEKGVVEISLIVRARFTNQVGKDNVLSKKCTAVVIDPNYLLASQSCKGLSATATSLDHHGMPSTRTVEFRRLEKVFIEGRPAKEFFEDDASKTILIRADASDAKTVKIMAGRPAANLFILTNDAATSQAFSTAVVNKEGFFFGRTANEAPLKKICTQKGCFLLPQEARTGDPAFFMSALKPGMEFLAGFNSADVDGVKRQSGFFYRPFNKSLPAFLNKRLSPPARARVQKKTVDEAFFK